MKYLRGKWECQEIQEHNIPGRLELTSLTSTEDVMEACLDCNFVPHKKLKHWKQAVGQKYGMRMIRSQHND